MSGKSPHNGDGGEEDRPVEAAIPSKSLRHELLTPLNQIIGYSELLQEEMDDGGLEEFLPDLAKITEAGRQLMRLINQVKLPSTAPDYPAVQAELGSSPSEEIGGDPEGTVYIPAGQSTPATATILVVDDNRMNRDMLSRRLERHGHITMVAEGGRQALELINGQMFDLILLDIMMPEMSGIEVLVELRKTRSVAELPVIMATARTSSHDIVEAFAKGANDYVTKPLDMPVVLARIATQLVLKDARVQVERLNQRIAEAQEQLATLAESSVDAVADLSSWSVQVASQVARAVGAGEITVWLKEEDGLKALTDTQTRAPKGDEMEYLETSEAHLHRENELVIRVTGLSGHFFGVLVASGVNDTLGQTERRLLDSFARQLGGVMELRKMQHDLAEAETRRMATRQEMIERGIDLLQICPRCKRCYSQSEETCAKDGFGLRSLQVLPLNVVDRYQLTRLLGQGGMGLVFQARDLRLKRDVALKVIKSALFNNKEVRVRFEREAQLAGRIDHPGVVGVHDYGDLEDGSLYLVLELLRGSALSEMISTWGPGTPKQVARMMRQGAAGLASAHRVGLIHRDIKPENIFLVGDEQGFQTKILDFGMAKELDQDTHLTRTGSLVGTPRYMSPEQAQVKELDASSDIYSFAAVAFLALTGREILEGRSFVQVLLEVVSGAAPLLSSILHDVPAVVDEGFKEALIKDPEQRPSEVEEWVEAFAGALESWDRDVPGWLDDENKLRDGGDGTGFGPGNDPTASVQTRPDLLSTSSMDMEMGQPGKDLLDLD